MSDTIRTTGFENDVDVVQALKPQAVADNTPVLSAAIDTGGSHARKRILVVVPTAIGSHGITYTVTESATSGGTYAAATTSGTATKITADGVEYFTVARNPAKQFIKITATGDTASMAAVISAVVIFISDTF